MANLFRPFRAPGEERRSGQDRRGPNRQGGGDRRGTPRRAFVRRPMPMGPGALLGEVLVAPDQAWPCKVWDLGQGGSCVFIQQPVALGANLPVQLQLRCSYEPLSYSLLAVVAWSAQEGVSTFIGLAFAQPVVEGPFYERYFRPYF